MHGKIHHVSGVCILPLIAEWEVAYTGNRVYFFLMQQDRVHTRNNNEVCCLVNDYVEVGSLAVFVSGVIVNWKMFTIDGVWQLKKLKLNWKYISLTVKYPTHTSKIFCTIILPSNHFHSSENSSSHSLSSLTPSPSRRTERAIASEA